MELHFASTERRIAKQCAETVKKLLKGLAIRTHHDDDAVLKSFLDFAGLQRYSYGEIAGLLQDDSMPVLVRSFSLSVLLAPDLVFLPFKFGANPDQVTMFNQFQHGNFRWNSREVFEVKSWPSELQILAAELLVTYIDVTQSATYRNSQPFQAFRGIYDQIALKLLECLDPESDLANRLLQKLIISEVGPYYPEGGRIDNVRFESFMRSNISVVWRKQMNDRAQEILHDQDVLFFGRQLYVRHLDTLLFNGKGLKYPVELLAYQLQAYAELLEPGEINQLDFDHATEIETLLLNHSSSAYEVFLKLLQGWLINPDFRLQVDGYLEVAKRFQILYKDVSAVASRLEALIEAEEKKLVQMRDAANAEAKINENRQRRIDTILAELRALWAYLSTPTFARTD